VGCRCLVVVQKEMVEGLVWEVGKGRLRSCQTFMFDTLVFFLGMGCVYS
jgi:hypothetical protein